VQSASVFIDRDVSTGGLTFLEDFLACINRQFRKPGSESHDAAEEYNEACLNGESTSKRLELIRAALHSQLESYDHTFLVFDGYDRLAQEVQLLLDHELSSLQDHRLRILQTRRIPVYNIPLDMRCNGEDCEEFWSLNLYWVCNYLILYQQGYGSQSTDM
jgi:hypothetical protein